MSNPQFKTLQNKSGRTKALTIGKTTYELPADAYACFTTEVADKFIERMGKEVETLNFDLLDPSVSLADIHTAGVRWLANNTGNPYLTQFTTEEFENRITKKMEYRDVRVSYADFQTISGVILPNETHHEDYRGGILVHWARNDGKREILQLPPLTVKPVSSRLGQSMLNSASQNIKGNFANLIETAPLYDKQGNKTFLPEFESWTYENLRNYLYLCLDDPRGSEAQYLGESSKKLNHVMKLTPTSGELRAYASKVRLWINLYFKIIDKNTRLPTAQEFKDFISDEVEEVETPVSGKELNDQEQSV